VTVFERHDRIGGLLRYGIPDFKMDKAVLDRRLAMLAAGGGPVPNQRPCQASTWMPRISKAFDAVVLCIGATSAPRPAPARTGVAGHPFRHGFSGPAKPPRRRGRPGRPAQAPISATGKHVIVIGGGDTGSDCIGTCIRQKARSVVNFEAVAQPPPGARPISPGPTIPPGCAPAAPTKRAASGTGVF
jgi:glutamate synthase (NADPH) small chain